MVDGHADKGRVGRSDGQGLGGGREEWKVERELEKWHHLPHAAG